MVGFIDNPTIKEEEELSELVDQLSDVGKSNDPLDLSFPELDDLSLSFVDSFLDFDWIEENPDSCSMADLKPDPDWFGLEKAKLGVDEKQIEMCEDGFYKEIKVGDSVVGDGCGKLRNLACCLLEEQMGKVTLEALSDGSTLVDTNVMERIVGGNINGVNSGEIVTSSFGDMKSGEIVVNGDEGSELVGIDGGIMKTGEIRSVVCDGEKSVEMVGAVGNCVKGGEVVSFDGNSAKIGVIENVSGTGLKSGEIVSDEDEMVVNGVEGSEVVGVDVKSGETVVNGLEGSEVVGVDGYIMKSGEIRSVVCDGGKSAEMVGAVGNCVKGGEVVSFDGNGAKIGDIESVNGTGVKTGEIGSDEGESDSDSESQSGSTSSSSSSSEGDVEGEIGEEEEEKKREMERDVDVEEGEIRDFDANEMVAWSDDEDDDGRGSLMGGPVRSKNEFKGLPLVPPANVILQAYHRTLAVGVVLSILGAQVIVEGVEKHNPLGESSILWITESRSPLGIVDEIFGPVKNPYYVVRYNSEIEVPGGICQGTLVSFVPEFASHILNDNNLYKKGYDASGENDEEAFDEAEFSDDEKEAEYKRMLKMMKRGTTDQKLGNRKKDQKKFKNRGVGIWKNDQPSVTQAPAACVSQLPLGQNQHFVSPVTASVDPNNCSSSCVSRQRFVGGPGMAPTMAQPPGFTAPNDGIWTNVVPCQQPPLSVGFSNGFPTNGMPWLHQNHLQQPYQMPNGVPFHQPFDNSQSLHSSDFGAVPVFASWAACLGQSSINQSPFEMGFQSQDLMNVGGQPAVPGSHHASQKFSQGLYSSRGRKSYHRGGGGRFGGGRGWQRSK